MRVLVIGAGVLGAALAHRLAARGARVTVLEAGRIAAGASGATFGWTNAAHKRPRPYFDLNVAGMAAHAALADELGGAPWLHRGGRLEWAAERARPGLERAVVRLQAWGYAAEWIPAAAARKLEPAVRPDHGGEAPVAYFPDEGWVDAAAFARALLAAARGHGLDLREGEAVRALLLAGDRVVGVRTAGGRELEADVVVNCAGDAVNAFVEDRALQVPMASTVGLLALGPAPGAPLRHVIGAGGLGVRPAGGGQLMLHAVEAEAMVAADPRPPARATAGRWMMARLREVLVGVGAADPDRLLTVRRPIPRDGYPVTGRPGGVEGYYVLVAHSGVTLAPVLAAAVATELLDGAASPALAPFRPDRAGLASAPGL